MRATYLLVLLACLLGTLPLELVLHVGVYRRWRRLLLALLPTVVIFSAWDLAAVHAGWWSFDPRQISGLFLPGRLPVEELLFFVVVPLCSILGLEAVRAVTHWRAGDD